MDFETLLPHLPELAAGFRATLVLTVAAFAAAFAAALALAAATALGPRWLVRLTAIYTEFMLGMPVLVLLYVVYFVLPRLGIRLGETTAGIVTLAAYYSPYIAEAIRAALVAVPRGQLDAARMIGLTEARLLWRVILPQAAGVLLPPLTGILIGLAKDTAILSVISVQEFAYATKQVVSRTYAPFEVWALVAAAWWVTLTLFELAMRRLEARLTRYRANQEIRA